MMILQTERLELILLTPDELALWAADLPALERALRCVYQATPMQGVFRDIVLGQQRKAQADPANCLFHSFFLLLRKADRVIVGAADFKSPPNADGEVELGYGLGEAHERHGYMTEAVRAMCAFAAEQSGISALTAETEPDGLASQRILARCGFKRDTRKAGCWWILRPDDAASTPQRQAARETP